MAESARELFLSAEEDLRGADAALVEGRYGPACTLAQNSAEVAVNALHMSLCKEPWVRGIAALLGDLPLPVQVDLIKRARVLESIDVTASGIHILANADGRGAEAERTEGAVQCARDILEFVRSQIERADD